jgi:hypothetical protein
MGNRKERLRMGALSSEYIFMLVALLIINIRCHYEQRVNGKYHFCEKTTYSSFIYRNGSEVARAQQGRGLFHGEERQCAVMGCCLIQSAIDYT